jgi:hypothetical protein
VRAVRVTSFRGNITAWKEAPVTWGKNLCPEGREEGQSKQLQDNGGAATTVLVPRGESGQGRAGARRLHAYEMRILTGVRGSHSRSGGIGSVAVCFGDRLGEMEADDLYIDYTELAKPYPKGEGLERLAEAIGRRLKLSPTYTGRGPDGGKDLTFTEIQQGPVEARRVKWLVSCKDHADSGAAVKEDEIAGVRDKLDQHDCQGFLLITTTTIGTAAKALLDGVLEASRGDRLTTVWNSSWLDSFLLKEENHDLLRQFFPNSYKSLRGLTTLEGALLAFRDELPDQVMSEILRLIRPFSHHALKGSKVWPNEPVTAEQIDRIVTHLLIESDVNAAVEDVSQIDVSAFRRLLDQIYENYDAEAVELARAVIETTEDYDLAFNAYNFVNENDEISPPDYIRFLSKLDDDALRILLWDEIQCFVEEQVLRNAEGVEVYNRLLNLARNADITDAHIESLSFETTDHKIAFSGELGVCARLTYSDDDEGGVWRNFDGRFQGYMDEFGIYLESAIVDTSEYWQE